MIMIMIGIDPHKATHTAVAVDDHEVVLGELTVRASTVQADRLRCWAAGFDDRQWAVEAANGLGDLVAQQLVAAGETVFVLGQCRTCSKVVVRDRPDATTAAGYRAPVRLVLGQRGGRPTLGDRGDNDHQPSRFGQDVRP